MKLFKRMYSEHRNDFKTICNFIIENNDFIANNTSWSFQRFVDWRYGVYEHRRSIAAFWEKNLILFYDPLDRLAGFGICEDGGEAIAIVTGKGYRFLFGDMLDYAMEIWACKEEFKIEISEKMDLEQKVLIGKGFSKHSQFYKRCVDLTSNLIDKPILPEGYKIISMKTPEDYRSQRILRANGFSGKSDLSEEEISKQLEITYYSHQSPTYNASTDLCVVKDSISVSSCEALINPWCLDAEIERICTHSNYQRRGFGKAVIIECLYRLKHMGFKKAYIVGYSKEAISLYGKIGAKDEVKMFMYSKKNI